MKDQQFDSERQHAALAGTCDLKTRFDAGIRQRAIAALRLQPGETVLDAGCGTGWCLPMLSFGVQQGGKAIGFEPSPDMLALAHVRVVNQNLANVELLKSFGETVVPGRAPDAILFSYTHDLIRSRASLKNIFCQAKSGTRIVAVSTKLFPKWFFVDNWHLRKTHQLTITNFDSFDRPWTLLAELTAACSVRTTLPGSRYLFEGRLP